MNSRLLLRCTTVVALLLTLSLNVATAEPIDETVQALRNLDNSIASNQLAQAESQLQALQQRIPNDTRLDQAKRSISAAYVQQGEAALKAGNLAGASQALGQAQRVMPVGNQQATALAAAIAQAKEQQQAVAAENTAKAKAQAEAEARKAEQARQQKLAAERKAAEAEAAQAATAAKPKPQQAQLIDPKAPSSTIALPMLDTQDNDALRALLDQVAKEVVSFNCKVKIEVRQTKNYPWVASLLSARVKKIDPAFNLQLEQLINPANAPQLVLYPQP